MAQSATLCLPPPSLHKPTNPTHIRNPARHRATDGSLARPHLNMPPHHDLPVQLRPGCTFEALAHPFEEGELYGQRRFACEEPNSEHSRDKRESTESVGRIHRMSVGFMLRNPTLLTRQSRHGRPSRPTRMTWQEVGPLFGQMGCHESKRGLHYL